MNRLLDFIGSLAVGLVFAGPSLGLPRFVVGIAAIVAYASGKAGDRGIPFMNGKLRTGLTPPQGSPAADVPIPPELKKPSAL
jgi:hypothetical protein